MYCYYVIKLSLLSLSPRPEMCVSIAFINTLSSDLYSGSQALFQKPPELRECLPEAFGFI